MVRDGSSYLPSAIREECLSSKLSPRRVPLIAVGFAKDGTTYPASLGRFMLEPPALGLDLDLSHVSIGSPFTTLFRSKLVNGLLPASTNLGRDTYVHDWILMKMVNLPLHRRTTRPEFGCPWNGLCSCYGTSCNTTPLSRPTTKAQSAHPRGKHHQETLFDVPRPRKQPKV